MKINLQAIIDGEKLDPRTLSKQLYPAAKFPDMALKRVLKEEAVLNADQIVKLCSITRLTASDVFDYPNGWISRPLKGSELIFESGEYTARLNTSTWTLSLEHKNSLFFEEILCSKTIPVSEFTKLIDKQILIFKNKK